MNDKQNVISGDEPDEFEEIAACVWSDDQNSCRFVRVLKSKVVLCEVEGVLNI